MTSTKINTLQMVRQIRERHAEQLRGKTAAERIAYYRAKAHMLRAKAEQILQAQPSSEEHDEEPTR